MSDTDRLARASPGSHGHVTATSGTGRGGDPQPRDRRVARTLHVGTRHVERDRGRLAGASPLRPESRPPSVLCSGICGIDFWDASHICTVTSRRLTPVEVCVLTPTSQSPRRARIRMPYTAIPIATVHVVFTRSTSLPTCVHKSSPLINPAPRRRGAASRLASYSPHHAPHRPQTSQLT